MVDNDTHAMGGGLCQNEEHAHEYGLGDKSAFLGLVDIHDDGSYSVIT